MKADVAWLAGLLEGEGHFRGGYVVLEMCDREVIERAIEIAATRLGAEKPPVIVRDRRGELGRSAHSISYKVAWSGASGTAIVVAVYRMLSKRRQQQAALEVGKPTRRVEWIEQEAICKKFGNSFTYRRNRASGAIRSKCDECAADSSLSERTTRAEDNRRRP